MKVEWRFFFFKGVEVVITYMFFSEYGKQI